MKSVIKKILFLYFLLVIIKIIMSYFIKTPMGFDDSLEYTKMARNFFVSGNLFINAEPTMQYLPFYPILISVSYIFKDMEIVYFFIKIINSFLSSLILFPSWLLAKEFLTKKKALKVGILISILPPMFAFSFYIMGENILYTLILFSIYFLYKSIITNNYKWDISAGIFIGLSYLTKITSIILVFLVGIIIIINLIRKNFIQIKNKIILLIISFVTISYWLFSNISLYGFNICGIFHYCEIGEEIGIKAKFNILIFKDFLYFFGSKLVYITLATGVILFVLAVSYLYIKRDTILKNKKLRSFCFLTILLLFLSIILVALYNFHGNFGARPLERYFAYIYPLILILAFISLNEGVSTGYNTKKIFFICLSLSVLFGVFYKLNAFQLFPMNNMSLAHIGLINFILNKFLTDLRFLVVFILFITIPWIILLFYKLDLFTFKKLFFIFLVFFILLSTLNYTMIYYDSNYRWNTLDQMKLGRWFNSYDKGKSIVLFDKKDIDLFEYYEPEDKMNAILKKVHMPNYIMGFWMNNDILFDYTNKTLDVDYIISSQNLNLQIIKQNEDMDNPIYIYKTK